MAQSTAQELASLIQKLQDQRQQHMDAVAQIDATFEQFGITAAPAKKRRCRRKNTRIAKPGRSVRKGVTKAKKGKRRVRRQYATSGLDSILAFVKKAGTKGATTAEIVKHWKSEKRSGDGYTTLGELVKAKKLNRKKLDGAKGSRYTAA